jgi:iron complex outermembrane receptor protein
MTNARTQLYRRTLFASAASLATIIATPAVAQDAPAAPPTAPAPAAGTSPVNTDQIVITGTRRTDRTVTNSASPIDVISSQELTTQPTANLLDTVKNIVPSFYVGQNSISDASSFVRAPSLRGLSADEVLV